MSNPTALIGSTGFVGGNLAQQFHFDETFNSSTISNAFDTPYSTVVSAGPGAVKWKANKFPDEDWAMVETYIQNLKKINAEFVVAISTCDVYEVPQNVDEDTDVVVTLPTLHPYGKHRFLLEEEIRKQFPEFLIVRLPALFGHGLKKNVIFDLLNNNMLETIHSESVFQFYNLEYLWRDITRAREQGITLLNITSEPISVREIAKECFGKEFTNIPESIPAQYDVHSKHAKNFGGADGYLYAKASVLHDIKKFVTQEK